MARRTRTATTATPPAATIAPTSEPMPLGTAHVPAHWTLTNARPMSRPHTPATMMATNATALAPTDGNADGPGIGGAGPSDTRRS